MKNSYSVRVLVCAALLLLATGNPLAQQSGPKRGPASVSERDVRAHMEFLASDALRGRGSGTVFELIAGEYLAAQLRRYGIEPGGTQNASGKRSLIQTVEIRRDAFAEPPGLIYSSGGKSHTLVHGREMVIFRIYSESVRGNLQKLRSGEKPKKGSVVFVRTKDTKPVNISKLLGPLLDSGAAAVLLEETPQLRAGWERFASRPVGYSSFGGSTGNFRTALAIVSSSAAEQLAAAEDGTEIEISGRLAAPNIARTWNTVGVIRGTDPKLSSEVILLSAHMDHVGERKNAPGDDKIFNGADDDASGCVAVLELARELAAGAPPKRTVYFVFFGSEEAGGFGSRYFVGNLPFPKEKLVANLQFEMIGRPDPKVAEDELWLTGFERSNLGAELAKHGAKLVKDPHPEENFFRRSDNYTLARQGIVAHTVSSFGLHKDYHHASDEIGTIDFRHMTRAINSMVRPVRWLVNSDFRPSWYEGKRP